MLFEYDLSNELGWPDWIKLRTEGSAVAMTNEAILEKVRSIVAEISEVDAERVTLQSSPDQPRRVGFAGPSEHRAQSRAGVRSSILAGADRAHGERRKNSSRCSLRAQQ